MAKCGFGALVVSMLMLVTSLALTIVATLTDFWFNVETSGVASDYDRHYNNYHFGFWRKCYDTVPTDISVDDLVGADNKCVFIYENLIPRSDGNISSEEKLVNDLKLSYISLAIGSGALQLATIFVLLCGSWPGDCQKMRQSVLYICSTLVLLLATMSGIASGVCFIAAIDVEEEELFMYSNNNQDITIDTQYGWSFMLHWIGTGLCLVNGFIVLCMLRFSYEEVNDSAKYYNNM